MEDRKGGLRWGIAMVDRNRGPCRKLFVMKVHGAVELRVGWFWVGCAWEVAQCKRGGRRMEGIFMVELVGQPGRRP